MDSLGLGPWHSSGFHLDSLPCGRMSAVLLRWTSHPVIAAMRDNKDSSYIIFLAYQYCRVGASKVSTYIMELWNYQARASEFLCNCSAAQNRYLAQVDILRNYRGV